MAKAAKKKGGRSRIGAKPITVRVAPDLLIRLDAYRATFYDYPSRPEAMRRMIEAALDIFEMGGASASAARAEADQ